MTIVALIYALIIASAVLAFGASNTSDASGPFFDYGHPVTTPHSILHCRFGDPCETYPTVYLGGGHTSTIYAQITDGNNFGLGIRPNQVTIRETTYGRTREQDTDRNVLTLRTSWLYLSAVAANENFMVVTGSAVSGFEGFFVYTFWDPRDPKVGPRNPKLIYSNPTVTYTGGIESRISTIFLTYSGQLTFGVNDYLRRAGTESGPFRVSRLVRFEIDPVTPSVREKDSVSLGHRVESIDQIYPTGDLVVTLTGDFGEERYAYVINSNGKTRVIYR